MSNVLAKFFRRYNIEHTHTSSLEIKNLKSSISDFKFKNTLTGFKINYRFKILSNQVSFSQSRFYYTDRPTREYIIRVKSPLSLDPLYITKTIEKKGYFVCNGSFKNNSIALKFVIRGHPVELGRFKRVKAYFEGVGRITQYGNKYVEYCVEGYYEFYEIIKHFNEYPLTNDKLQI
jgi:hypothetical protein